MLTYYDVDIIPIILKIFNANNIIISGLSDKRTVNQVFKYCQENNASYIAFDSKDSDDYEFIKNYTLNELPNFKDYDAIFINDDPNWYTVFNELNIIKSNNSQFPLVFICNNVFPHKRRDSYINPDIIPDEFRNEYTKKLNFQDVEINDNFYHAIDEDTPKNGVQTAIEDFLNDNMSVRLININFINGITILYPFNDTSRSLLSKLTEEVEGYDLDYEDLVDDMVENQFLIDYIFNSSISQTNQLTDEELLKLNENKSIINEYENKIRLHDTELSYKNSQIESLGSKLDLKESMIKNFESKLVNRENEISTLKNELKEKEQVFNTQIKDIDSEIASLKSSISQKEQIETKLRDANNQIKIQQRVMDDKELMLNSIKCQYINQLSKLDNKEYCISCYKEEISNNHLEIQYLKDNSFIKKILSPFAYIFLIMKSNPKELALNFKLYNALKNSKCFDIGYYLNSNKDILGSKWCKYFSPELHYVCNGFKEERKFNKKYFNRNSKKELLDYVLNCQ